MHKRTVFMLLTAMLMFCPAVLSASGTTTLPPFPAAPSASGNEEARWVEAMLDLRAEVQAMLKERTVSPFFTGIMYGNEPARELIVDISGYDELWLVAIGEPDYHHGQAVWGAPMLEDRSGKTTGLTTLEPI